MERRIVEREAVLPFRPIPAAAVRGQNPVALARNTATLARGTVAAGRLIAELRPAAILGTGGYVCVPLFVAARLAGVPTIIYLPDVVPGLAIRALAMLATRVACNVEDSARYLRLPIDDLRLDSVQSPGVPSQIVNRKSRLHVVGYPVRAELFGQDRTACVRSFGLDPAQKVVLVYGGSRGARSINRAIEALLPHLLSLTQIVHVCGREGDEAFLRAAAERLPPELQERYRLYEYLHSGRSDKVTRWQGDKATEGESQADETSSPPHLVTPSMTRAFGAADLAVCRSGASTLAELPAAGLPAVLVPYPYVHQEENADYLVRRGAAVKVADAEMLGVGRTEDGLLYRTIRRLLEENPERTLMHERSRALARPDAARRLADLLLDLAARGAQA